MKTSVSFILLAFALYFQKGDAQIAWTTPSGGTGTASVAEDAAAAAAVETLVATSTGQTVGPYTLVTTGSPFTISTAGALTVTAANTLDYETVPTHVLEIKAVDDTAVTPLTSTATLTVSVTNVANDPVFGATSYSTCVADGTTASSSVYTIAATDPNGDTLTYTITNGNTNTDFTIAAGGVISTANALVTATTGSYSLEVKAADAALTATVTLVVAVAAVCSSATAFVVSSLTILTALVVALH